MLARRFPWWRRTPQAPLPRCRRSDDQPVLEEDERPLGCGWFDSSHELLRGLIVIDRPPDRVPDRVTDRVCAGRTADRCG